MTKPLISVVVCTYNRAEMLRDALSSLQCQVIAVPFEIVVVDNNSTDETSDVIRASALKSPSTIRAVRELRRGVSWARNRGIAESRGEWIAFFDDDQLADPNWLSELLSMARLSKCRCVGGRVRLLLSESELESLPIECRGLLGETINLTEPQEYNRKVMPGTGNLMIHRAVFEDVGEFDTTLIEGGEDTDLFRRLADSGIAAWFTPAAVVHHTVPEYRRSERYFLWASRRIGWQLAKRENRRFGHFGLAVRLVGRCGQALLGYYPGFVRARLADDSRETLNSRCLIARWQGYRASASRLLLPRWFSHDSLESQVDFASERHEFAHRGMCEVLVSAEPIEEAVA